MTTERKIKLATIFTLVALVLLVLVGCRPDAMVASHNLSRAADQFEIDRRIVFYNGINGEYLLTIEGKCSIKDEKYQLEVTCKTGEDSYKKHFLGLSDNVTYFAEQTASIGVSVFHHRIIFKPQSIVPNVDLEVDIKTGVETLTK